MFSESPSFFVLFEIMCFEISPAPGSPASVSDHVMTSQDYIKVEHVRLDFLLLVLQSSNSFDLNAFFPVLFKLIPTVYKSHSQLLYLVAVCSTGLFCLG